MLGGGDLRERRGFAGIGFVTARAEYGSVGKLRGDRTWIIGMIRQRSMAGFASDASMRAFALHLGLVGMADLAGFAAGEFDGPGLYLIESARSEMAVLSEIGRDDGVPDQEERNHSQNQQNPDTDQVFRAAKEILHAGEGCNPASGGGLNARS